MDIVELLKTTIRNKSHPDHIDHHSGKSKSKQEQPEMPRETLPVQTKLGGDKLFESLNLTNLNVSFNSANMHEAKRRLEESRTQALLMKSFAYNEGKEELLDDGGEEKEGEQDEDYDDDSEVSKVSENEQDGSEATPRSSNLYQSESEHNGRNDNVNNEDADEFDADPGTDNCTSRSASVIDD